MVFVSGRRSEQGEDAVARRLNDIIPVTMDGIDHQLECGIDNRTSLLGLKLLHQLHGALYIDEESGHSLALPIERG